MKDRIDEALESFDLANLDPRDRISPNFRIYELTVSELAMRQGISNRFETNEKLRAAIHLARNVLQPIREAFDKPYSPNSVFRSQALERVLKRRPATWISTSQHTTGCACDIEIPGVPTLELAERAVEILGEFDQIICECYDPRLGPNAGWVHISLCAPDSGKKNRGKKLSYIRDPHTDRMVYVSGLRASVA